MMDPVTLLLAVTAAQAVTRLAEALARRWVLRGRAEVTRAAAGLPPGVELSERDSEGAGLLVRTKPMQGRPW